MLPESSRDLSPLAAVTCSHTGCPFTEYRASVIMHAVVVEVFAWSGRVCDHAHWLAVLVFRMTSHLYSMIKLVLQCYSSHKDSDPHRLRCFQH